MKLHVHTLRFGNPDWLQLCAPTLEAWCTTWGHTLTVWDDSTAFEQSYHCPKLVEIDAIKAFLESDATHFAWVDGDVYVHPDCPNMPDFKGIALATDCYHAEHQQHWEDWCEEHYGSRPKGFAYSNAGVYFLDRKAAGKLVKLMVPPFIEQFQEQHQFLMWVYKSGIKVTKLGSEWNRFAADYEPAWMRHAWGPDKMRDFEECRESGMLHCRPDGLRYSIHPGHTPYQDKIIYLQYVAKCGLGNQLFETAAAYTICRKLGVPVRLQHVDTGYREFGMKHFGFGVLPAREIPLVSHKVGQGHPLHITHALQRITDSEHRTVAVCNPYQSEACFADYADEIRELFKLELITLPNPPDTTPIAVQVRRGDYVGHSRLDVCTPEYFQNAMTWMRGKYPDAHFIVVSDDIGWCKRALAATDVTFVEGQSAFDDLRTIASCEAHIISNSTFGWWGAWLGENGPVCVPEIWHHKPGSYGDWKPAPERWIRIPIAGNEAKRVLPPVIPQTFFRTEAEPKHDRAIVYPWHADQEKGWELLTSLRSVQKHFADKDCPIYIMGTRRPGFLNELDQRVRYVGAYTYKQALEKGLAVAKSVLWMNDDTWFVRDCNWRESSISRYLRDVGPDFLAKVEEQTNPWRRSCVYLLKKLAEQGITDQKVFSTHAPYFYDSEKALACIEEFGFVDKMPLEIPYFHRHGLDKAFPIGNRISYGLPVHEDSWWLNAADRHLTEELRAEVFRRFPEPAPWEVK